VKIPHIAFGTPRRLPNASKLPGRVVVLDIAFAAEGTGHSFERVTAVFLQALGERLAAWVDHHDHPYHTRFRDDPRFVLCTKAEHGACPEMVSPALVARTGPVDSIVSHTDVDGLYAAAKWIRGGEEPYAGADEDARAIDTRTGEPSPMAVLIDRALRVRGRDEGFLVRMVTTLVEHGTVGDEVREAARAFTALEDRSRALGDERFEVHGAVAWCDVTDVAPKEFDKTELLLQGQKRCPVAVVVDGQNVTLAAPFDSGIDFLTMLGVGGGMPTRVSVPRGRLREVREILEREGFWR